MSKIYSDVHISGQFVYDNNPKAGHILVSDVDGIISFATPSVYYAGMGLTLSGSTFSLVSVNTKRIYVSVNGSDSNDGLTDATPFRNIKAGRDLAVSGDTVIVMPGEYIYDNRNSNSNYWNSRISDINLWKNGVTYYFEPGSKIIYYNQTSSGSLLGGYPMYLLKPTGLVFETCNIFGYLEFEGIGIGPDNSNGHMYLFDGITLNSVDAGYTTYIQVKSITTNSNQAIIISRGTTPTNKATVTIYADSYKHIYTSGQSGAGVSVFISGSAVSSMEYYQNIRYIFSQINTGLDFRGDLSYTFINITGDTFISNSSTAIQMRLSGATSSSYLSGQGVINVDIKKIYFAGPPQNIASVIHNYNSSGLPFIFNLKGDCIEYIANGNAKTLFGISGTNTASRVINYTGDIYTITTSGETSQSLYSQGRRISYISGTGSILNVKGNINYNGTLVTLKEMFKTAYSGVINYTGNIRGNFGCPITKCNTGEVNIYNSTIISDIDSYASSLISNGFNYINSNGGLNGNFATGKIKISNSYIKLRNSGNYIGNGGYINAMISNSIIINSGTAGYGIINSAPYYADPMTNGWTSDSTSTGILQMSNSSIIVSATTSSIYYTGSASVILANSSTNASWFVGSGLIGSVDLITELKH